MEWIAAVAHPGGLRPKCPAPSFMKKRTKHGHFGQARTARLSGKVPPAGNTVTVVYDEAEATSRQREACPAAERSVLCPKCPCSVRFLIGVITRTRCYPELRRGSPAQRCTNVSKCVRELLALAARRSTSSLASFSLSLATSTEEPTMRRRHPAQGARHACT